MNEPVKSSSEPTLQRHFGLWQATALNVTMIVGAGVFAVIPYMMKELPGPYALLGWIAGAVLMLLDGMIWSELGAMMPGSGGTALYLLEGFGRKKFGRAMSFLFIWQFLLSGPLEIGSGLIAMATFARNLHPSFHSFDQRYSWSFELNWDKDMAIVVGTSPAQWLSLALGIVIIFLLYRRITTLGKLTVALWLGVLAAMAWILIEGLFRFDSKGVFSFSGSPASGPVDFASKLSATMYMAMYSYFGYYSACYIGDEVRQPGKNIPRSIFLSVLLVTIMFIGLHLALVSVVPWRDIPADDEALKSYSLAADFMERLHGNWAMMAITLLLIGSSFASAFAGMLGYARIPYAAAKEGHFFSIFRAVHPKHRIPHVGLFLVGALTLLWSFLDLGNVIKALIVTRILEQFVAQIIAVMILRRTQPDRPRPYRIWLYPVPCLLALVGWLFLYFTSGLVFIVLGLATLTLGIVAFLIWAGKTQTWPFATADVSA
ncbi:MAG TPA: APC family permease [Gemmataceae bacterium]|jgi:amino acid transporter|nr:APC family permease [Gemmataceae bacterium]